MCLHITVSGSMFARKGTMLRGSKPNIILFSVLTSELVEGERTKSDTYPTVIIK